MQDRIATLMILRSIQEVADELKAIRRELKDLRRSERPDRDDDPARARTGTYEVPRVAAWRQRSRS